MTNAAAHPGISFAPGNGGSSPAAPIHDIVGPLPFFQGVPWVIPVLVAAVLAAGMVWWFAFRRKERVLTPRELALKELARLRAGLEDGSDHEFGVCVSGVLRRFLGEELGLAAPRQTTEEFLGSLRGSRRFLAAEQEALAEFLHRSDFLKYARGEATPGQREALIAAAESFVRSGEEKGKGTPLPKEAA
jgi:hypothetical protein